MLQVYVGFSALWENVKFYESLPLKFHRMSHASSGSSSCSVVKEVGPDLHTTQWPPAVIGLWDSDINDGFQMRRPGGLSESASFTQWACLRTFLDSISGVTGISAFHRRQAKVFLCYLFIYCRRLLLFWRCCACAFMCLSIIQIMSRWTILNRMDYPPSWSRSSLSASFCRRRNSPHTENGRR